MTSIAGLLDLFLVLTLLWLAWNLLRSEDLFRAVVLFIIFGLLMVIAWVRLKAPDIALAEAAIGTGLTGALLLDAIGYMDREAGLAKRGPERGAVSAKKEGRGKYVFSPFLLLLLIVIAGFTMVRVVTSLPDYPEGLAGNVDSNMALSGVRSRVTAVLLNFRGYDTLLEIGVMLAAVTGVISLRGRDKAGYQSGGPAGALLPAFTGVIVPVGIMVGAFFLYEGGHAPGGAFQSGSVLAAVLVLLRLSGFQPPSRLGRKTTEALIFAGFILFLLVAGIAAFIGNYLLEYPPGLAGALIFIIEAALSVSIAFMLAELFSSWRAP